MKVPPLFETRIGSSKASGEISYSKYRGALSSVQKNAS